MNYFRPTLDDLRKQYKAIKKSQSRFNKSECKFCGAMVTNQAMGRASHMRMHERKNSTSAS